MVRIIPWNLPPVKGGSIGGYTPDSGGSDPAPVVKYVDFSNAVIYNGSTPNQMRLKFPPTVLSNGQSLNANGVENTTLTGMTIESIVGVASISCVLEVQLLDTGYTITDNTATLILDPVTLNITGATGTVTYVDPGTLYTTSLAFTVSKLTFVVYNGNGEILQTEEITPGA